ncbi:MAG: hypothetical protein FWG75_11190 [Cystobacterineae bacterium]|nr:hypothetical protein [Cystobacterineae bacterium]
MHEREKWVAYWWEQKALSAKQVPKALRLLGIPLSREEWHLWLNRLLLWLGVAALCVGLIFLVAFISSGVGRFEKFMLLKLAIIASLVAYVYCERFPYGKVALVAAILATCVWLSLMCIGYPWGGYTEPRADINNKLFVGMALMDGGTWVAWEWFERSRAWMRGRWVPRLWASMAGGMATWLAIFAVMERHINIYYAMPHLLAIPLAYILYRHKKPDLFVLSGLALSIIAVAGARLGRVMYSHTDNHLILFSSVGLFFCLTTAGAAWWLQRLSLKLKKDNSATERPSQKHEELSA